MKFSIIIPTYNEEKYIDKCLSSITFQNFRDYEIIIADCGSDDKTIDICKKYTKNIFISKYKSVALQRNLGADKSNGEYLIFLDADTQIFEDYFKVISFYLNKYDAISFSLKFNVNECKFLALENLINLYFGMKNYLSKYVSLIGYNIIIRKTLFFNIGGFNNVLLEDIDISTRIPKKNSRYITTHSVITSPRKYKKNGIIRTLRYFWELILYNNFPQYGKYFKYTKYINVR